MPLPAGTRLGPYEIVATLGAGGMGEVYRARDTRLDRTVAVKVLSAQLAERPEWRLRFEREARAVSALNHPHICALYDIGQQDGLDFLVMEYLEGETLAARLARGPLPLQQALRLAVEMAGALALAHRQGVFHRDLKPGNVMLTKAGAKLLDFGLAKIGQKAGPADATLAADLTQRGTILGTVQYMAPEQVEGRDTDARSDIFSFGAVLYEMVTGRKAFEAPSHASIMAAILEKDPPTASSLLPAVPPALDRVVKKCLAKDADERWQSAADLASELGWIGGGGGVAAAEPVRGTRPPGRAAWAVAALAMMAAAALGLAVWFRSAPVSPVIRASVAAPENTIFDGLGAFGGPAVLSPDGRRLAFVAMSADGQRQLWVRPLDTLAASPPAGTDGAYYPFWSPDSRSLGFFAQGKLRRIDAAGGPVQTLCDAEEGRGGAWTPDGTILFSPSIQSPIYRIPTAGGAPAPVTKLDATQGATAHRWPHVLPDGRHFLLTGTRPGAGVESVGLGIYVASLDSGQSTLLLPVLSNAIYAAGHLLFVREGTLLAQPMEASPPRLTGEAVPIVKQVQTWRAGGRATFSASETGILVYDGGGQSDSRLIWFDREGKRLAELGDPAGYGSPALSPDGRSVAVEVREARTGIPDLWIYDVGRGVRTRFTFAGGVHLYPLWSPDGSQLVYAAIRKGQFDLYRRALAAKEEELLVGSSFRKLPSSWSPDARYLLFGLLHPKTKWDLWVLPLTGGAKPFAFLETEFDEIYAELSPDGRWVAYASNESGSPEIYVAPFREAPFSGAGKIRVSPAGGTEPRWRRDGRELFYVATDGRVTAVEVRQQGASLAMGTAHGLFAALAPKPEPTSNTYAVSADGRRFLVNAFTEHAASPLSLVVNWPAELQR